MTNFIKKCHMFHRPILLDYYYTNHQTVFDSYYLNLLIISTSQTNFLITMNLLIIVWPLIDSYYFIYISIIQLPFGSYHVILWFILSLKKKIKFSQLFLGFFFNQFSSKLFAHILTYLTWIHLKLPIRKKSQTHKFN